MIFSLAAWPAAGKFLLSLDSIIDIIHFASIPIFASFLFLLKPGFQKKNVISLCSFLSIIVTVLLFYSVIYTRTIPDIQINWLELPLALYFLMSVYLILWFVDKAINSIFLLIFAKISTNKATTTPARTILRMAVLIFVVAPYLIAIFITHWIKFADIEKPQSLKQSQYSQVEFSAVDGAKLKGWFISSQNKISDSTVMVVSGRSAAKNLFIPYAKIFTENGYNVLLFDLRGNGSSSGHKYSFAIEEVNDVIAAIDYLQNNKNGLSNYIFGYGINEGAAALIGAAAIDERFAAIISDNANGYEIKIPDWLESYVPNWVEKSFIETTKMFVRLDMGCPIWGETGMYAKVSQISPCPILFSNSVRNTKYTRMKTIELYVKAREPKNLWLPPTFDSNETYDQYFVNVFQTFETGKLKQQSGNWRISKNVQ